MLVRRLSCLAKQVPMRLIATDSKRNHNGEDGIDIERLTNFFLKAEKVVKKESVEVCGTPDAATSTQTKIDTNTKNDEESSEKRRFSNASRFVPWTSNRFLNECHAQKVPTKVSSKSFAKLFRDSTFVQLGNFKQRELIGVVVENVRDTDLYIDFGGKFHAVCPQPSGQFFPRGSLVRIRLRDPEMANRFMINTKAISLHEAEAVLLGPYRGQLLSGSHADSRLVTEFIPFPEDAEANFRDNKRAVLLEHWKLD